MLAGELETIQSYGLTEYEAKAYLALVELEEATAREVADVSRVPRTKIYGVIDELHKKSLVEVIPERPKRFLPISFDAYLSKFEKQFKDQLSRVKQDKERFKELLAPSEVPTLKGPGQFRVVKGRKNVLNKTLEMLEGAEKSVWLLGSAFAPLRINYFSPLMHDKVADGLIVHIQCPVLESNRVDIEEAMAYAEVRHRASENSGSSLLLIDGREVLVTHYIPDDTHLFKGEDVSMWTDDPAIVADMTELMAHVWTESEAAEKRLTALARSSGAVSVAEEVVE